MKPLLICRMGRTKLVVHIARKLKELGVVNEACAFVAYYDKWRDFLQQEREVPITQIFGTADIYQRMGDEPKLAPGELERIEAQYGGSELWNIIFTEWMLIPHVHSRYVGYSYFDRDDILRYFVYSIRYFEMVLDKTEVDCIIDLASVGIFRGALDLVAQARGIPYYYPFTVALADLQRGDRLIINRHVMEDYHFMLPRLTHALQHPEENETGWQYLRRFRDSGAKSLYNLWEGAPTNPATYKKPVTAKRIRRLLTFWLRPFIQIYKELRVHYRSISDPVIRYNFHLHKELFSVRLRRSLLGAIRRFNNQYLVKYHSVPIAGKYAFMTLHYQPEVTTSVMAPFQVNQLAVVENIARTLPLDWTLVVKPNKVNIITDDLSYLRHLSKIPNVKLVGYSANTRVLIEGAQCVFAITGTSGFEAALLGKKVFLMGDRLVVWHLLDNVEQITDWHQIRPALSQLAEFKANDQAIAAFLQTLHEYTFALEEDYVWSSSQDLTCPGYVRGVVAMAEAIAKADEHRRLGG